MGMPAPSTNSPVRQARRGPLAAARATWTEVVLWPLRDDDTRPWIRITRYPQSWADQESKQTLEARADEWADY